MDWEDGKWDVDPARSLVYLDDHQVIMDRIPAFSAVGIRHVILEDNYKAGEGGTANDRAGFTTKQLFTQKDADASYLWKNLVRYAESPPLVPPSVCLGKHPQKAAGAFLHPSDSGRDIVEPMLRPDMEGNQPDRDAYERICRKIGIGSGSDHVDPDLHDMESYMQIMNYDYIAYFELVPMSPRLKRLNGLPRKKK